MTFIEAAKEIDDYMFNVYGNEYVVLKTELINENYVFLIKEQYSVDSYKLIIEPSGKLKNQYGYDVIDVGLGAYEEPEMQKLFSDFKAKWYKEE